MVVKKQISTHGVWCWGTSFPRLTRPTPASVSIPTSGFTVASDHIVEGLVEIHDVCKSNESDYYKGDGDVE